MPEAGRRAEPKLEGFLGGRAEPQAACSPQPAAPGGADSVQRAGAEGGIGGAPDSVQVDAERGERLGVQRVRTARRAAGLATAQLGEVQPRGRQRLGGRARLGEQSQQQVLGADVIISGAYRLMLSAHDSAPGVLAESFEHADLSSSAKLAACVLLVHGLLADAKEECD